MKSKSASLASGESGYLDGQLLVAMPGMADQRFARAVIYLCAHSDDGAMGIIVNKRARKITFQELLAQLKLADTQAPIRAGSGAEGIRVLNGGPVDTQRGFVLHSPDYHSDNATLAVDDDVSLTATVDVLKAIAEGRGPRQCLLALGYAGWSAGQLETEIQQNGWLSCPADQGLLFDDEFETKYTRALRKLGIDVAALSGQAGHA